MFISKGSHMVTKLLVDLVKVDAFKEPGLLYHTFSHVPASASFVAYDILSDYISEPQKKVVSATLLCHTL